MRAMPLITGISGVKSSISSGSPAYIFRGSVETTALLMAGMQSSAGSVYLGITNSRDCYNPWFYPICCSAALCGIFQHPNFIRNLVFPHITLRQSQGVTVVFIALAAVTHHIVQRSRALVLGQRDAEFRLLFAHNPLPMWVYVETLRFLEVMQEVAFLTVNESRSQLSPPNQPITPRTCIVRYDFLTPGREF